MKVFFFRNRLKDISIAKKLYFIVGAMAVLIIVELLSLWFAIHTLSSVRAFVGAEGLWSKAQKDAVYNLKEYSLSHSENDYQLFQKSMDVPLGDHKTLVELLKKNPDLNVAGQGFLQGRVHPDDIDGMLKLFSRFNKVYYINKAIAVWTSADSLLTQLIPIAAAIYKEVNSPVFLQKNLDLLTKKIDVVNQQLPLFEDDFSYTLGEGSRWLENLIQKILLIVALTVEITGLVLTIFVTRGITKELKEIKKATNKITKGDLTARTKVLSKNEIGQVASQVNEMAEQLIISNKELEQVAYIASHDLQEPLGTIANFVGLFQRQYKGKLDKNSDEYLGFISDATLRMQTLVNDLLDYSRIGVEKNMEELDCNKMLQEVLQDMATHIAESNAEINTSRLPVIYAFTELKSLFQNLISNAIKFHKKNVRPVVNITARDDGKDWIFTIQDNGIGIEEKYQERIFTIFQRLHSSANYAGTGIGLAHCKKIVDLLRGKIWVESEPEKGSSFNFTVPKTTYLNEKEI